jgi:uncharacterized LabA/DUF88 family protein
LGHHSSLVGSFSWLSLGRKDRRKAVFSHLAEGNIRTHVYIDGYNLYYGRLRGTPYKWLDVVALMKNIVKVQHGSFDVQAVHYFSAPAKEAFATHRKDSVVAQQTYHRALIARHSEPMFKMTLGNHSFDRRDRVRVWSLEEKQTDVNLALAMYRACAKSLCEQVVVCSNDSDVEPVLAAIREDFPEVAIGLITPASPNDEHRRFSKSLAKHAHWVRRHISDDELQASQLPHNVPTKKKPASKPDHW